MIRFTAQSVTVDAAAGDEPTRTISGIAVPYGVEASVSTGQRVSVEAGALPPFRSRTPRRTDTGAVRAVVSHSGTPPSDMRACGGTTLRNDSLPCSPAAASASCSSAIRASGAAPSRQRTCRPRP